MLKKLLFWVITGLVLVIIVAPLAWIYLTAFKSPADLFAADLTRFVVFQPTLENFVVLFRDYPFWSNLLNTFLVSVAGTVVTMAASLMAAYSFARAGAGS